MNIVEGPKLIVVVVVVVLFLVLVLVLVATSFAKSSSHNLRGSLCVKNNQISLFSSWFSSPSLLFYSFFTAFRKI